MQLRSTDFKIPRPKKIQKIALLSTTKSFNFHLKRVAPEVKLMLYRVSQLPLSNFPVCTDMVGAQT